MQGIYGKIQNLEIDMDCDIAGKSSKNKHIQMRLSISYICRIQNPDIPRARPGTAAHGGPQRGGGARQGGAERRWGVTGAGRSGAPAA